MGRGREGCPPPFAGNWRHIAAARQGHRRHHKPRHDDGNQTTHPPPQAHSDGMPVNMLSPR